MFTNDNYKQMGPKLYSFWELSDLNSTNLLSWHWMPFYLVSLNFEITAIKKKKKSGSLVNFISSPASGIQSFCAPRDYDSYTNRWCQSSRPDPAGAAWCSVSPCTIGVIHTISLIFHCGKDTKHRILGNVLRFPISLEEIIYM